VEAWHRGCSVEDATLSHGDPFDRDEPFALNAEPTVPTSSTEADEIRRQMAVIRHSLHQDVRGVVATAEKVANWSRYLGRYPWVSLGIACGVGYVLVPKRRRIEAVPVDVSSLSEAIQAAPASVTAIARDREVKEKEKSGLIGAAFGLLAPIAVRAAQSYALNYLENWIAQQHLLQAGTGPPPHPGGPPRDARSRTTHP
jgi:hypothetical protein